MTPDQTPIDMVLHCPKCGMQHIDKDNYEELRIEAAELGVDREGERELERWIEDREWPNPPHRSHLCQNRKCGHIWRPADVPTNGVAAIKTAGTKDDPITSLSVEFKILKAEHDNLKSSYDRLKLAYDAWHEKMNVPILDQDKRWELINKTQGQQLSAQKLLRFRHTDNHPYATVDIAPLHLA